MLCNKQAYFNDEFYEIYLIHFGITNRQQAKDKWYLLDLPCKNYIR